MDFGDILNQWDETTAKPYGKKRIKDEVRIEAEKPRPATEAPRANPIDVWLRRNGIEDKDSRLDETGEPETPAARRRRLHGMKCEATIDLHGLTREEGWARLESFFADCIRRKLSKVLIIHGKGTHSEDDPVLKRMVRLFLEQNPHAGESGHPDHAEGGSGSTWVLLK